MSPLFFISRSRPLSPFFSLGFAGLPPFSFSLSFSCSIFQICCNKRKKTWALRCDGKKRIIREMPGILKKLRLKNYSVPFLIYFNWSLSVKAVNDDSYRNESERKLLTMTLHDYDVKRPNFTFCGVPERKTTIFISFSKLWQGPLEFNTRKKNFASIWQIERDGIRAILRILGGGGGGRLVW